MGKCISILLDGRINGVGEELNREKMMPVFTSRYQNLEKS
jgi:hypothetical protein